MRELYRIMFTMHIDPGKVVGLGRSKACTSSSSNSKVPHWARLQELTTGTYKLDFIDSCIR